MPAPTFAVAGTLSVTYQGRIVTISGSVTGLAQSMSDAGIHVHTGTDCTNGGQTTAAAVNTFIGGHLMSGSIDGWVFPTPTTYDTDSTGAANIDVSASGYTMENVKDRCVVLHGLSPSSMGNRVAIGKILQDGTASFMKYPGPNNLASTPSGTLLVTAQGGGIRLQGTLTGLAANLNGAGIHVHTGTDCTGGSDTSSTTAVNNVIGGHYLTLGDGFLQTKYSSDAAGASTINIATPKGSYTLMADLATTSVPAVENHCIVMHSATGSRVGIGQIVCSSGTCTAEMGAYPMVYVDGDGATTHILALSALVVAFISSLF